MSEAEEASPLRSATQGVRDAAKYLIAAFGAIGAVLVGGLSFTALPSAGHPAIAAIAVGLAVFALTGLISLGVVVLTPGAVTLGGLARLEEEAPKSSIIRRLKRDEELFVGQVPNLRSFHNKYVEVLKERAQRQEEYLQNPEDSNLKTATQVAAARAVLLDEAAGHVLETANFFRVEGLFSPARRKLIIGLALFVVAMAGVFAWASAKPVAPATYPLVSSNEKIWLEHLVATSDFRIERLKEDQESGSTAAVRKRANYGLSLQRAVQRQERRAILGMVDKSADSE